MTAKPIDRSRLREFVTMQIAGLPNPAPWQWVSFADGSLPEGSRFLGVAIVRAHNVGHAAMVAHDRGINPGGEVLAAPVPEEFGPPPPEWDHKLIRDKAEIERLTKLWHGCGIKSVAELEDEAERQASRGFRVKVRGAANPMIADFRCDEHGVFEASAPHGADFAPCPTCGASSAWTPSPVAGRVRQGEVVRGKSDGPRHRRDLATSALADGMSLSEFRKRRREMWREERIAEVRRKL